MAENTASADTATLPEIEEQPEVRKKRQPKYNVVLLDDDDHTYEYVIRMLERIFGHSHERAYKFACAVDRDGRVILLTTTREHAELKQEQIHAFGIDPLIAHCKGSMSAILEPVDE